MRSKPNDQLLIPIHEAEKRDDSTTPAEAGQEPLRRFKSQANVPKRGTQVGHQAKLIGSESGNPTPPPNKDDGQRAHSAHPKPRGNGEENIHAHPSLEACPEAMRECHGSKNAPGGIYASQ